MTAPKPLNVLLIEDDEASTDALARYLSRHGVTVLTAATLAEGRRKIEDDRPDLLVLDLGLPDGDGIQFVADLRRNSEIPVVVVSGRTEDVDRIMALEMGADDYVVKPVNPRELLARISAVHKRAGGALRPSGKMLDVIAFGDFKLDMDRRRLEGASLGLVDLTAGEFDILVLLAQNPGRPLSRETILSTTRARNLGVFDRSVDNLIARLRRKIGEPRHIETVRGVGYRFIENP